MPRWGRVRTVHRRIRARAVGPVPRRKWTRVVVPVCRRIRVGQVVDQQQAALAVCLRRDGVPPRQWVCQDAPAVDLAHEMPVGRPDLQPAGAAAVVDAGGDRFGHHQFHVSGPVLGQARSPGVGEQDANSCAAEASAISSAESLCRRARSTYTISRSSNRSR